MSNIISNDDPQWKQLCLAAVAELDPAKLPERIDAARRAILDRIEDGHSKSLNREHLALRDALATLSVLRTIAKRHICESRKTGI